MKQAPQKPAEKPALGNRQKALIEVRKSAQRKKIGIVAVLFVVMAVLWIRLFLLKGGPKQISAAQDSNAAVPAESPKEPEIIYVDLPVIAGRHDAIENDLFALRNFKGFKKVGESAAESEAGSADANALSEELAAAAEQLELTAIVKDKKAQAYINDNLFEVGQVYRFIFHNKTYDFKIKNIFEDKIELECNGTIITKKIPESHLETEQ